MKSSANRAPLFLAVISAIFAALPFAIPFLSIFFTLICLVPFMIGLTQCLNGKAAWKFGYTYGFITIAFQVFFFYSLTSRWTQSVVMGLIPWVIGSLLGACYFGLVGWMSYRVIQRKWFFALPFIWVAIEVIRSYIPLLAFPWGLVATPLAQYPHLIGFAHYLSIFGGSFWVASIAALAAGAFAITDPRIRKPQIRILAVFVVGPILLNFVPHHPRTQPVTVLICQPGVDTGFTEPATAQALLNAAANKTIAIAKRTHPDMTIFPEGFARVMNPSFIKTSFPVSPQYPVVFGAQRGTGPIYQSVFSYDGTWHWADKTRLVIFGEYVPFRHELPFLGGFNLPSADLTPGESPSTLPIKNITLGPMVCFEELFPDISYHLTEKHAQMIAVVSDDAWFTGSYAPIQLNQACVWRAIETGLPLVRSGMTGFSDIIAADGVIQKELPFGPIGSLSGTVNVPVSPKVPSWLPIFPLLSLALGLVLPLFGSKPTLDL